ncbi:cytochrome c biogenesis CcdA family protein [Caloranaerobacter azorensis]|uniref:Cytochrome C biogenesis protein DsbD n=2 Tax=Caloranaerobacter azorensis TaxID=116090 RepID=A0A096BI25_9FIRM|nr:cytochrome c biogenesis protein CcdA [Caloranaerobacter azorensis]KGG80860.1 cytochrome C biogenesis protein DsbD [Caloranaerobacter azorensis H53214]QIB27770.1 cytochrome C biogenesis protein CcdA [Caloranaerobacter azorensis]
MTDVSIPIAFSAGVLSFLSPCVLPLIPAYITYITGSTFEEELANRKFLAVSRTLGFVIGFTIIFMLMGISASFIGRIFIKYKSIFTRISGILIIIFGLNMLGFKMEFLNREKRMQTPKITNWFSSILMGMAFAAGWTPCIGSVLATILIYAGTTATLSKGFYLLLSYSVGLAIPFILTALLISQFSKFLIKFEKIIPYIMKISGIIVISFGILIFLNKIYLISNIFIR